MPAFATDIEFQSLTPDPLAISAGSSSGLPSFPPTSRPWPNFSYCLPSCWFETSEMEANFREKHVEAVIPFTLWWCVIHFAIIVALGALRVVHYGLLTWLIASHAYPLGILLVLFIVVKWIPQLHPHTEKLLCSVCLMILAWTGWLAHEMTIGDLHIAHAPQMAPVWEALGTNEFAIQLLEDYIGEEESRKCCYMSLAHLTLLFSSLSFLGFNSGLALVFLCIPLTFAASTFLSPVIPDGVIEFLISSTLVAVCGVFQGMFMRQLWRRQFKMGYVLQQALAQKANTMQELVRREKALKETSQEADTVLNHILKNTMADAAGCIHLFLSTAGCTPPSELVQAISCLERGMTWCRKRQAILRITAGNYSPTLAPIQLAQFGSFVVRGREVITEFIEQTVALDALLCDIVLDNAITNAFRHGDPADPDVHFTMQFTPCPTEGATGRLAFQVTNRARPGDPLLTKETVDRIVSGDLEVHRTLTTPTSVMSENLGLPHIFMAGKTHGMEVSLQQFGDCVVFEAVMDVVCETQPSETPCDLVQQVPVFPPGLKVVCIDDSEVARRFLMHTLSAHLPNATVYCFGATAAEVEVFIDAVLSGAHIVILDNHLNYPEAQYLGTEVLAALRAKGYEGFVCMRSADAAPEDEIAYLKSGAQCSMGKDLSPQGLVSLLASAYMDFRDKADAGQLFTTKRQNRLQLDSRSFTRPKSDELVTSGGDMHILSFLPS